jgi:hypothetical protein
MMIVVTDEGVEVWWGFVKLMSFGADTTTKLGQDDMLKPNDDVCYC